MAKYGAGVIDGQTFDVDSSRGFKWKL